MKRRFLRVIAGITVFVFSWNQIVFSEGANPYQEYQTKSIQSETDAAVARLSTTSSQVVTDTTTDFLSGADAPLSPTFQASPPNDPNKTFDPDGKLRTEITLAGHTIRHVYAEESIQTVIDSAVSGDTVYLHSGTYHAHLILAQGIDLQGEDQATTIIHGDFQAGSHVIRALGDNRIEGLTITGGGPYSGMPSSAVRVEGDNVKIRNNQILDNRDYGIHIVTGQSTLIEMNFFKDTHLGVQLPNDTAVIRYNTFVHNDIAVNVLNGAKPRIENNIFTGSTFQSIYEFSWSAYASGQASRGFAIVENNTFFNNTERGSYYGSATPPAAETQSAGNQQADPGFVDAAHGNYSIGTASAAYGRGCYLPVGLKNALDRASHILASSTFRNILDGTNIIGYEAVYAEGSREQFYNDGRQVLDTTPPVLTILSTMVLTNQTSYSLRYVVEGIEHIETRTLVEGSNTLMIEAADIFGNKATASLAVTLDRTAPAGGVRLNSGNAYTNTGVFRIEMKAEDALSGLGDFRISLDGGATWEVWQDLDVRARTIYVSRSFPDGIERFSYDRENWHGWEETDELAYRYAIDMTLALGELTDGEYSFSMQLRDKAGNVSGLYQDTIIYDGTLPQGSIGLRDYPSNNYFYDFPLTLSLSATDSLSGVQKMRFSLDGGTQWTDWENYNAERRISLEEAKTLYDYYGTNTVRFMAEFKDQAGNVRRESFSSTRDGEFAQGTVSINGGAASTNSREVTLDLTAHDAVSGVRGIQIQVLNSDSSVYSDTGLIPFESSRTVTLPAGDGSKTILYYVCDWATCASSSSYAITLDTIAPEGTVGIVGGQAFTLQRNIQLTLSAEVGATVRVWEEGQAVSATFSAVTSPYDFTLTEGDGAKRVHAEFRDRAGNTTLTHTDVELITGEPVLAMTSEASVAGSGAQDYTLTYTVDGQSMSSNWKLGNGLNRLFVTGQDRYGRAFQEIFEVTWASPQISEPVPFDPADASLVSITQNGFVLKYKNGGLVSVEKLEEYTFQSLEFDANQNLTGGLLVYPANSQVYYKNDQVVWRKDPQETKYYFNADGSLREIVTAANQKTVFAYEKNDQGQTLFINATTGSITARYAAAGQLLQTVNAANDITNYANGMLDSVHLADGDVISYAKIPVLPSGTKIALNSPAPESYPESVEYDTGGNITEVVQQSGIRILFQEGVPSKVIDPDLTESDYIFGANPMGDFTSFNLTRMGYIQTFDGAGNLQSIVTPGGDTFSITGTSVTGLRLLDGTTAENFTIDTATRRIQNGTVTSPDGVKTEYADGKVIRMETPEGLAYAFTYDLQGNATASLTHAGSAGSGAFSELIYDNDMNLVSSKSLGGELLHFFDQRVDHIDVPGGDPILFEYTPDPADPAKLIQVVTTQGETRTTYDGQGSITHSTIQLPGVEGVLDLFYQYDRIRKVKKDGVLFSTYTYEFDAMGGEITVVSEVTSGIVRSYQDGRLIAVIQADGMTTQYEYGADGKVSKSTVSWKGRTQSEFTYTYDGDITYILDDEGITQGFDVDGKLVRILQDGDVYLVHYLPAGGPEKTAQELIQRTLPDGIVIHYKMGKVIKIEYPDGTRTQDIIEDSNGKLFSARIYHSNGSVERIVNGKKIEMVRPDGTILSYQDGKITEARNALGVAIPLSEIEASWWTLATLDYAQLATTLSRADESKDLNKGRIIANAGDLLTVEMPDGRKLEYKSGKLLRAIEAGTGEITEYSYEGDIVIVAESGSKKYFNAAGDLFKFVDYKGNTFTVTANLTGGVISSYQLNMDGLTVMLTLDQDGKVAAVQSSDPSAGVVKEQFFSFRYQVGTIPLRLQDLSLQATVRITEDGNQRLRLVASGEVDQLSGDMILIQKDGITYEYQLGQLTQLIESNGDQTLYGKEGDLTTVSKGGITYFYDAQGNLKKYSVQDSEGLHTWELDSTQTYYTRHTVEDSMGLVLEERYDPQGRVLYEKTREEVGSTDFGPNIVPAGDAHLVDTPGFLGGVAAHFDGNGDYLSIPDSPDWDFGTGDFTLETFVHWNSVRNNQTILDYGTYNSGKGVLLIYSSGSMYVYVNGSVKTFPFDPILNAWDHIAVSRSSGTISFFVDGRKTGTDWANTANIDAGTNGITLGRYTGSTENPFMGEMKEIRISNTARYTSDFTPSQTPFVSDSNTKLLLHFDRYHYVEHQYARDVNHLPLHLDTSILNLNTRTPLTGPMTIREIGTGYEWFKNPSPASTLTTPIPPIFTLKRLAGDFTTGQMAAEDVMYSVFDAEDKLISTIQKNGIYTTYERGKVRQIWDRAGVLLVEYTYDADGVVVFVSYPKARKELEEQMIAARLQVEVVKMQALLDLAAQYNTALEQVETEYNNAIEYLQAQRAQLEGQRYQKVCRKTLCWTSCETVEVPGVSAAIEQVNSAVNRAIQDRESALLNIPEQVDQAKTSIETQIAVTFVELDQNEKQGKENIQRQEITPVVFSWYRKILGRDPSLAEYDYWIAQTAYNAAFNLQALKDNLLASAELATRMQSISQIQTAVQSFLTRYNGITENAMTAAEKLAELDRLGIRGEAVVLSRADLDQMILWINAQGLHFGQSAYLALEAMLDDASIAYTRETLATDLILIDILTGILTPFESGDLVISLYALKKKAALYGLEVVNASLDYDSLQALPRDADGNLTKRVIAHINKNHFVIITKVTAQEVTYIDPGMGADHQNQVMTAAKGEFIAMWDGAVMLAKPVYDFLQAMSQPPPLPQPPQVAGGSVLEAEGASAGFRLLTDAESMRVRGAFLGAIFNFLKDLFVATFNLVVDLITLSYHQIINLFTLQFDDFFRDTKTDLQQIITDLRVIADISVSFIADTLAIVPFIGKPVSRFFKKVATFVIDGAEVTFRAMIQALPDNLQDAVKFIQDPIGGIVQILGAGMQAGLAHTLTTFGISQEKAAKIAGIATGAIKLVVGAVLFAVTGNTAVLAQGFYDVATGFGLDPTLASAIAIAGSALAGGVIDGDPATTAFQALKNAAPKIAGAFAQAGVIALGSTLGLDPRLTSLFSIPIGALVGGAVGGALDPKVSVWNAIKTAVTDSRVLGGMVTLGANIALEEIGLPPLAHELIRGFLSGFGQTDFGQYIFRKINEGIDRFTRWVTQGVSAVVDFGAKALNGAAQLTEAGFKNAVGFFSSIFSRQTQESIYADSTNLSNATVSVDGDIWTWQSGDSRVIYNVRTGAVGESFGVGGTAQIEGLGQDSAGHYTYSKLTYNTVTTEGTLTQIYNNGKLSEWQLLYADGSSLISRGNSWDAEGDLIIGDVEYRSSPILINGSEPNSPPQTYIPYSVIFRVINGQVITGRTNYQASTSGPGVGSGTTYTQPFYVLANGIGNNSQTTVPDYIVHLETDLLNQSKATANPLQATDMLGIPLYFPWTGNGAANKIIDAIRVLAEGQLPPIHFGNAASVISHLATSGLALSQRPIIGMGYSGGFVPLIEGLACGIYNVSSIVGLGAATVDFSKDLIDAVLAICDTAVHYTVGAVLSTMSWALDKLSIVGQAAADVINWIKDGLVENVFDKLREVLAPMQKIPIALLPTLANTKTEMLVNVWGSKDILSELGIGGYRSNLVGFTTDGITGAEGQITKKLFNIEIIGATHFDYMRDTNTPVKADACAGASATSDACWNATVSEFVTDLMVNSTSPATLDTFLRGNSYAIQHADPDGAWVVQLPGYGSR